MPFANPFILSLLILLITIRGYSLLFLLWYQLHCLMTMVY
jgi:hypothetical protein